MTKTAKSDVPNICVQVIKFVGFDSEGGEHGVLLGCHTV
jgi:hypothetical protein